MYLTIHDSHRKNCINFIDIGNITILHAKKTLVSKQNAYLFFTVLQSTSQQGLRISTAGCGMLNTDQDISNYSVPESIALTRSCSSLVYKVRSPRIFLG